MFCFLLLPKHEHPHKPDASHILQPTATSTMEEQTQINPKSKPKKSKISINVCRSKMQLDGCKFPSPGNLQATRVELLSQSDNNNQSTFGCFVSTRNKLFYAQASVTGGADTNSSTLPFHSLEEKEVPLNHKHEIQSIQLDAQRNLLACVDSYGITTVLSTKGVGLDSTAMDTNNDNGFSSYTITPPQNLLQTEPSFCGLSFNPSQSSQIAVCNMMNRASVVYDNTTPLLRIGSVNYPTFIKFFHMDALSNSQPMLAIAEYNQLAVYDIRSPTPCIKRIESNDPLYCIGNNNNVLATGGAARSLYMYDVKRWTLTSSWLNCLKYEIVHINFSSEDPRVCYVAGLDSSLGLNQWKGNFSGARFNHFVGDSRWIGVSKSPSSDYFVGVTEQGNMYAIHYDIKSATFESHSKPAPTSHPNQEAKKQKTS